MIRFLGGDPFAFYFCKHLFIIPYLLSSGFAGKKCPCKSLHWKFSDKRTCDGMCSTFIARIILYLNHYITECGHSPMQHVRDCSYVWLYIISSYSFHQTCLWNNEILTPIQKSGMQGPGKTAFKKLKTLLDRMMLRRTKVCLYRSFLLVLMYCFLD